MKPSTDFDLDDFVQAYMSAALWSSHGPEEDPHACENLDDLFGVDDIAPETAQTMRRECEDFIQTNKQDLLEYAEAMRNPEWSGEARAGHDFWLTRNYHGVGFWDRGLGALGDRLTKAAEACGERDLYPGDDGKVYQG